ncbi:SDR family NAD(P)-dependent oxidoreductase [Lignipirellula cremea]|uniref:3-oxoacyl-[acyl-carrier-protein] reductase FabG n=1 Tax=Lignipirellula cremea TaxID=2528010 RepID=A0A518DUT2_9BACT|nr:SDR family oxidoreductase [Lignipirellula cremea]QDU95597.1 3-oxoacyl-[acyl-carrier-protein] reductase FabG [Lignipirellula cremea]
MNNTTGKLAGKTALVTGGGRGIGLGCALELAGQGARIFLNDRPGSPELAGAVEQVRERGGECQGVEADVFTREGCEQLVAAVDRIDILVSNPAFSRRGDFVDYPTDLFEKTLQGTLLSGFHLGQLTARRMIQQGGGGKMVFISSVHGQLPLARAIAYNAAKAGLDHMVQSMAVELMAHRINVNAIAPGWIDTPGERATFPAELIESEGKLLPWGRLGLPAEIGKTALFLVSDDASYITGVILPVDGGFRFRDCLPSALPKPADY